MTVSDLAVHNKQDPQLEYQCDVVETLDHRRSAVAGHQCMHLHHLDMPQQLLLKIGCCARAMLCISHTCVAHCSTRLMDAPAGL
jgi:hypothetical protein